VNAGVLEVQNSGALGTPGHRQYRWRARRDHRRHNAGKLDQPRGGTISADGATIVNPLLNEAGGTAYSGPINVSANSRIAARHFYSTAVGETFTISSPITGTGNLQILVRPARPRPARPRSDGRRAA
jgi:hypothetical protein